MKKTKTHCWLSVLIMMVTPFLLKPALAQEPAWPDYRIMDANGFLKMMDDVMGPQFPGSTITAPNQLLWKKKPLLKLQIHYDDLGGTCDLNNPSSSNVGTHQVRTTAYAHGSASEQFPIPNHGNGLLSAEYQSGTYTSCDKNPHFSKENLSPIPLMTRFSWIYRACRMIGIRSNSYQITRFSKRIISDDPIQTSTIDGTQGLTASKDSPPPTTDQYNWCQNITYPQMNDYQKLFNAFYPGRTIPKKIEMEKLKNFDSGTTMLKRTSMTKVLPLDSSITKLLSVSDYIDVNQYYEYLLMLVSESDAFINSLASDKYLYNASNNTGLEDPCSSTGTSTTPPTLEQMKAINAWRALLMTFCMDPGAQVY